MKASRAIVGVGLAVTLAGGFLWALIPDPASVDLIAARRAPLEVSVSAEGVTRVRERWTVTAPVTGSLSRSPVAVGDPVEKGVTTVAVIQPAEPAFLDARARRLAEVSVTEAEATVRLAGSNLDRAETELAHVERELERYQNLAERGAVSVVVLENAAQAVATARSARDAAKYELELQEATLTRMQAQLSDPVAPSPDAQPSECCIQITAPQSGTVLDIPDVNARLVQAGSPLLTIGDLQDLQIEVDLLSTDATRITKGAVAHVDRWGGEGEIQARVSRIDPSGFTRVSALGIEEQRVRLLLDIVTPPEGRAGLGDGYRIFARIAIWADEDVLQIPQSALFRSDQRWAVFVEKDGRAEARPVEIGKMSGDWAEVLSGVVEGERVVAFPSSAIEAGMRLEARDLGAER